MIRSFYPLGNHASKNENNFVHLHVKFCSKTLTMKGFISKLQIIYLSNCCVNLLDNIINLEIHKFLVYKNLFLAPVVQFEHYYHRFNPKPNPN